MGAVCCRRQRVVTASTTVIVDRWLRMVVQYLETLRHPAFCQRIFSAASLFLRGRPTGLPDNTTRGRRLELV